MPTPAKDRFMRHVLETVNALEFNCLQLSKDIPKFNTFTLSHSISIITGMTQNIRKHLLVNAVELKKKLPKGVLKHGSQRLTERQKLKAARR